MARYISPIAYWTKTDWPEWTRAGWSDLLGTKNLEQQLLTEIPVSKEAWTISALNIAQPSKRSTRFGVEKV